MLEGQAGKAGDTISQGEQHGNTAEGLNVSLVYTSGTGRANLLAAHTNCCFELVTCITVYSKSEKTVN